MSNRVEDFRRGHADLIDSYFHVLEMARSFASVGMDGPSEQLREIAKSIFNANETMYEAFGGLIADEASASDQAMVEMLSAIRKSLEEK